MGSARGGYLGVLLVSVGLMTQMDAVHRPSSRRTGWLAGLVVGAASGFLALLAGPLGLLVALGFVPAVVRSRHALAPLAGLRIGAGSISVALITAAKASCTTVVTPTSYSSCTAPDLTIWIILAGAVVLAGVLLSIDLTLVALSPAIG